MKKVLLCLLLVIAVTSIEDILAYGAIPNEDTISAQLANSQAIIKAILAANSTQIH